MRTTDAEVTVAAWTTYYYIKDGSTGAVWSRNRWGASDAVPDLYASKRAAQRSCNRGKIHNSKSYGKVPAVYSCLFGYESSGIKRI